MKRFLFASIAGVLPVLLPLLGIHDSFAGSERRSMANTSSAPPWLGNISTRDLVQTGDNVMIGGFIISGTETKTVIVRAIGPALAPLGVTNPLADPTLELHDATQLIAS